MQLRVDNNQQAEIHVYDELLREYKHSQNSIILMIISDFVPSSSDESCDDLMGYV